MNPLQLTVVKADDAKVIEMMNLSMTPAPICCAFWIIGERNGTENLIVMGQVYCARDN
jgi:hypothetical protein